MDNVTIKKKLYELRIKAGYSQEDIADLLQISLNSYRKIEKGKTKLISDRLQDIAKIYNITTDNLIMEDNPGYGISLITKRKISRSRKQKRISKAGMIIFASGISFRNNSEQIEETDEDPETLSYARDHRSGLR